MHILKVGKGSKKNAGKIWSYHLLLPPLPSPHHKRFFAVNVNGVLAICSLLVGRRIADS